MQRSEAYWHVGGVVRDIRLVLDPARRLVKAGDGRAALPILEAITEEYIEGWPLLDDSDREACEIFDDLGPIWTEALLSIDLTATEREGWGNVLASWSDEIADYGVNYADDFAIARLNVLERRGRFQEQTSPHDASHIVAVGLADARSLAA